jgi:hypothetical protein
LNSIFDFLRESSWAGTAAALAGLLIVSRIAALLYKLRKSRAVFIALADSTRSKAGRAVGRARKVYPPSSCLRPSRFVASKWTTALFPLSIR